MNPLYKALGCNQAPVNPMTQLIEEAKRVQQTFNGDPKAEVQRLLNSGAMTQAQFNEFAQIANQLVGAGRMK